MCHDAPEEAGRHHVAQRKHHQDIVDEVSRSKRCYMRIYGKENKDPVAQGGRLPTTKQPVKSQCCTSKAAETLDSQGNGSTQGIGRQPIPMHTDARGSLLHNSISDSCSGHVHKLRRAAHLSLLQHERSRQLCA